MLRLQSFGHLMRRTASFKKTLMLGKIEGGRRRGQQRMRWLDGITDMDMSQWTWVWVNSGSWWWTGRPGVLQSKESQSQTRLSDWTEINWTSWMLLQYLCLVPDWGPWHFLWTMRFESGRAIRRVFHSPKQKTMNMHYGNEKSGQDWEHLCLGAGIYLIWYVLDPITLIFPVAQTVKNLLVMQESWVRSLDWEDPLEKGMANLLQYSCLENPMDRGTWWVIVWGHRVGHDWASNTNTTHWH